jgi:hypothetical protein
LSDDWIYFFIAYSFSAPLFGASSAEENRLFNGGILFRVARFFFVCT